MAPTVDITEGILVSFSIPIRLPIQAFKCIRTLRDCDSTLQIPGRNKSLSIVSQTYEPSALAVGVTTQMQQADNLQLASEGFSP